jgi:PfaD family protein
VRLGPEELADALVDVASPLFVVQVDGAIGIAMSGQATLSLETEGAAQSNGDGFPLRAYVPALAPERLGDAAFRAAHGVRYAYVAGAMANGIASEQLVEAMSRAGMLAFFGAAGLEPARVEQAIDRLQRSLSGKPHGFNLIHSPSEPDLEAAIVDLYLRRGVHRVSASAYLGLTLPLVRYRLHGIHRDAAGRIVTPNRVVAKVSRVEVAQKFFSPAPADMIHALVRCGELTADQAELAAHVPIAEDLTAEADSGGHTDNRPALALIPTMLALRDEMQQRHGYATRLRVGAAGGIATPASTAAAFAMGAAYVLTGTINQACVESGSSDAVRAMLASASQADVMMAPAADMFEMGVKVQVLKRGTMFGMRARKLYDLYRAHGSIEELPIAQRATLERDYFRCTLEEAWAQTRAFFAVRDPQQIARAESDPKHKLALVFRKYLGQSSKWANAGEPTRQADYQVWCGPAIGAFNEWTQGTFLQDPGRREVVTVARNLLTGAAALTRAGWLRAQGVVLPADAERFAPREVAELDALCCAPSAAVAEGAAR